VDVVRSDCIPTIATNPCGPYVPLPTSTDCAPGGLCDTLDGGSGTKNGQCGFSGFCVTGPLLLPLVGQVTTYTPDASGTMYLGWDDVNTSATLNMDGTWALPGASLPVGPPNALQVTFGTALQMGLDCVMAGDNGSGLASPAPDALLIALPITP
jgi:hypothetical protein